MTAEAPEGSAPRQTKLSAFDIACVVVGGIIGIGIFFTPSKVAAVVGSPWHVVAAWGLGGLMIILGALVYARLSQLAPGHGGVFEYLRQGFGPMLAFLYGWCNLLLIQAGALGLVGLVRTLAWELGEYDIRANLISPGFVDGERLQRVVDGQAEAKGQTVEETRAQMTASSPLLRFVDPQNIAAAVVFLASDDAASITGEDFNVTSGLVMY